MRFIALLTIPVFLSGCGAPDRKTLLDDALKSIPSERIFAYTVNKNGTPQGAALLLFGQPTVSIERATDSAALPIAAKIDFQMLSIVVGRMQPPYPNARKVNSNGAVRGDSATFHYVWDQDDWKVDAMNPVNPDFLGESGVFNAPRELISEAGAQRILDEYVRLFARESNAEGSDASRKDVGGRLFTIGPRTEYPAEFKELVSYLNREWPAEFPIE